MQYTILNLEQVNELTRQYEIDEIISHKVLSGGSENTNYLITSESESYVLTICEQKSIAEAKNLSLLLEHLADHSFSTSKIIRNKEGQPISTFNEKPVILKTFLEGKIMSDLPLHLIELIGAELGKLHQVEAPNYLPNSLSYGIEQFSDIELYDKGSPFHDWLKKIEEQSSTYLSKKMPKTLIHSDVFYSNVIVESDEKSVTIMDFEEATYYYRVFDVGMTIVGICGEGEMINLDKVSSLLKGYVREIKLTDLEKTALQIFTIYAAASMSFWRHRNFNYTKPTPGMENHYLQLKNIADFVKELPEDCFEEMLRTK